MHDNNTHSFVLLEHFTDVPNYPPRLSANTVSLVGHSVNTSFSDWKPRPLSEISRIVRRVHDHVCSHSSFGDMRPLLPRNNLGNSDSQRILTSGVKKCKHCITVSPPKSDRKVSIAAINRGFNEVVCVDHFHLDDLRMFHVMDSHSRYSAALSVPSMSLSDAIVAFESIWVSQFWPPLSVQGDLAFQHPEFVNLLSQYGTSFPPVPPRRHHKNVLESKHDIIRAIFIRLKSASPSSLPALFVSSVVRISNDLYGSDTMS